MLNIPAGWKLVPERATQAMEDAWDATPANEDINAEFHAAYAALLDAAPTPPSVAPGDAQDERSPTHGMTLGERIAHVGGRTNAQGYTEFGSPMAVNALIQHVLRDIDWTRQDDDGGYQARYRLPGGQWSSWGHVVCGVKGHEQELRCLPGVRRAAPAAGDAQTAAARDVLAERQRQISAEGWTAERDDTYAACELADAAAQYVLRAAGWKHLDVWPWEPSWIKLSTPRRNLVKAGALILAEIERLDRRAALSAQVPQQGEA